VSNPSLSPGFRKSFLRLFLPSATQNLFFSLITILDVLMVGQLGDVPVSAVGLSGQFFFLLNLSLFGTTSGSAMFAAQYWGANDQANLRRVLGLCLSICLTVAAAFAFTALAFPAWVMRLYTQDPAVIAQGMSYLRIIGWSYLFSAVTIPFAAILRSTGNTRLPMLVSVSMLCLNTALNYTLIFGKFGLPALGVQGAATGTTTCRILECLIMLMIVYRLRAPIAATPRQLFGFDLRFISHHIRLILVVLVNEFLWALGVNVYNAMIARLGTSAYAAYSIAATIQNMGLFFAMGCAVTCSILVGQRIGAGKDQEAFQIAKTILMISTAGTFVLGLGMAAARFPLMKLYQVSEAAITDASAMLLIAGLTLWLRSLDAMFILGILRSGGDTRFSALVDVGAIWLAGIPAVALAAFVLHLPVEWVFCVILIENAVKSSFSFRRFLSRKWVRNLTQTPALVSTTPA
jgi:putative MATE family efflux protein